MYKKKSICLLFILVFFGYFTGSTVKADERMSHGGISFYESEPETPNEESLNKQNTDKENPVTQKLPDSNNSSSDTGQFPQTGEKNNPIVFFIGGALLFVGIMFIVIKMKASKKDRVNFK